MIVERKDWARSLLLWNDWPVHKHNLWALVAWQAAEGGYYDASGVWHAGALWNPLNTTEPWEGAWDFNWVHVKNYPGETVGLEAVSKTLRSKQYKGIVDSLKGAGAAADTLQEVSETNWGTGAFAKRILHDVKYRWPEYSTKAIGQ